MSSSMDADRRQRNETGLRRKRVGRRPVPDSQWRGKYFSQPASSPSNRAVAVFDHGGIARVRVIAPPRRRASISSDFLGSEASVNQHPDVDALDKLKARIQALRAKTIDNGCTESEAVSAAAKVAELLD